MSSLVSVYPRFAFPWALLVLLLVPASVYLGYRLRSLSPGRKWVAIALRGLIVTLLGFGLAGAEMVRKHDRLAVFFLLDHSNSVPEEVRRRSLEWVNAVCKEKMTKKDAAGVIVFGEEPSLELAIGPAAPLAEVKSFVGGEQTDIAAAMRLAMAAFPQGYMRRMVVVSDGNETLGQAVEEARVARSSEVGVDVLPLEVGGAAEVKIGEMIAPTRTGANEPFQLRVVIHASQPCAGDLTVYQRLKEGKQPIGRQRVDLLEGDNVILVGLKLEDAGFYEYEATFDPEAAGQDTVLANNLGRSFTVVRGVPTALYLEGDPATSVYLKPALEAEGLKVEMVDPDRAPTSLSMLQNYDVIILSNVPAPMLTTEQMNNLEAAVRDLGIGLIMIGGPEGFGAGGYLDSPVERALPVSMDLKERKILPRGALAVIMHTCEIPDGNVWAREIGLASLEVLASQDLMGALGFSYSAGAGYAGDVWLFPLQPVGDKTMMRRILTSASQTIGDMPSVAPTLKLAYDALKTADAAAKRVIIISDGDPGAPAPKLVTDLAAAGIAVSTVCINPHSLSDQKMLRDLAQATGGKYYYVQNPKNLPQIFTKEAAVVKRGVLIEETFTPKLHHDSELLMGLFEKGAPELKGYVATTPKDQAIVPLVSHEDDPILAHWRYGLGKSVAFTSDVTPRWAAAWLGWDGFNRFWAQTVRWAMREVPDSSFRVEVDQNQGVGRIKIDAVDDNGKFVNFLKPKAVVIGPGPDFDRHELDLIQTGPGLYEAAFPLGDQGTYMVNVTYTDPNGRSGMIPAGLALAYSREYEYNQTNLPLLESVAAAAGGKTLANADNPFVHDLKSSPTITPIWTPLVIVALCLFPLEIFVRRVAIDYGLFLAPFLALLRRVPALARRLQPPAKKVAPATGFYGARRPTPAPATAAPAAGAAGPPGPAGPDAQAPPASFGIEAEAMPAEIAAERKRSEKAAKQREEIKDALEYTSQLLAAKKRAREKTDRKKGGEEDK